MSFWAGSIDAGHEDGRKKEIHQETVCPKAFKQGPQAEHQQNRDKQEKISANMNPGERNFNFT